MLNPRPLEAPVITIFINANLTFKAQGKRLNAEGLTGCMFNPALAGWLMVYGITREVLAT
jgi:hypothetical protein